MKKMIFAVAPLAVLVACSSSSSTGTTPTGDTSAAVAGAADTHCNAKGAVKVDPNVCHMVIQDDAGAGDDGGMPMSDYGPTNFGSEADDDDCKYHVKWTASKVAEKSDVTFFLVVTTKSDNSPMTGSPVRAEVFLNDTHPAPNTTQSSKDEGGGNYTVGPIQFDASGQWTVRFHFHEECNDSETSPHGHAAFLVQVP